MMSSQLPWKRPEAPPPKAKTAMTIMAAIPAIRSPYSTAEAPALVAGRDLTDLVHGFPYGSSGAKQGAGRHDVQSRRPVVRSVDQLQVASAPATLEQVS